MSRILLVEDDIVTRILLQKNLEKNGHDIFACINGLEAYDVLQAGGSFDIIITDVLMPEMNGTELIDKIKNDTLLNKIPVIIMSGAVSIKDISEYLEHGAKFFLGKPIVTNDLLEYIQRCIS